MIGMIIAGIIISEGVSINFFMSNDVLLVAEHSVTPSHHGRSSLGALAFF